MSNSKVRGDEAAAVAALHVYFRDNPKAEPLTREFIAKASAQKPPVGRPDTVHNTPRFESYFEKFRDHIRNAPRDLFVESQVRLQGVKQGYLGDCYFVSMVGAALHSHRQQFEKMFQPRPDGGCDVLFPDGNKVIVKKLTDAQIALGSTAGKQGSWLNILEQGFGQLRARQEPKKLLPGDIPLDSISRGGNPSATISLLTGHKAESFNLAKSGKDPAVVEKIREAMIAGTKHHLLMASGTPAEGKLPPGVFNLHAYAVLGFDEKTNTVHLWNPHGSDFQPKVKPAGLSNEAIPSATVDSTCHSTISSRSLPPSIVRPRKPPRNKRTQNRSN